MAEKYTIERGVAQDVRKQITSYLDGIDDRLIIIEDYLGNTPSSGGIVVRMKFNASVAGGDPGSGYIATDNADPALVTKLYISVFNDTGNNITTLLQALENEAVIGIFEGLAPNATSYFQIGGAGTNQGNWFEFDIVDYSTISTLPQDQAAVDMYLIQSSARLLPPGGDTHWILRKIDGTDYNVEWVDGTTMYTPIEHLTDFDNPHQVRHSQVLDQTPDDHHNQNHLLYGPDHTDVNIDDPLAIRHLLAWDGFEFRPDYRMNWRGVWRDTVTYERQDTAVDQSYLGVANKQTTERLAPQPLGPPAWAMPDLPTWAQYEDTALIYSGHLYTFTETLEFRGLRVWVPEITENTNYRFVIVTNPNTNPTYTTIEEPVLNENDWTVLGLNSSIVTAGTELLIYIDALNSSSEQTWAYNWLRSPDDNNNPPAAGDWNKNTQDSLLRINHLDAEAVPVDHQLELRVVAGTVFEISEVGNPQNFIHFRTEGAYIEQIGYTEYPISVIDEGIGRPSVGAPSQIRAVQPIPNPTKFVGITGFWTTQQPVWANVESFLSLDGVNQGVDPTNAYGVDIIVQRLSVSEDWDIAAISGGGGSGGGEGGEFPEAPDDGTQPYGRDGVTQSWTEVPTRLEYETAGGVQDDRLDALETHPPRTDNPHSTTWDQTGAAQELVGQTDDVAYGRMYESAPTDDYVWKEVYTKEQIDTISSWLVDDSDHTASWLDRTIVEAPPSTITLPAAIDQTPDRDILLWNASDVVNQNVTIVPAAGHQFLFNGEFTGVDNPLTLRPSQCFRIVSRTVNLYQVLVEALTPFSGSGASDTGGFVPKNTLGEQGKFLGDDGAWHPVITQPGGGGVQLEYEFSSNTAPAPPSGVARINNVDPDLTTEVYISMTTINGNRFQAFWQALRTGDVVWFVDQLGGNTYGFEFGGPVTRGDGTSWDDATWVQGTIVQAISDGIIPDGTNILLDFLQNPESRVPPGGITGQVLAKTADSDYTTGWEWRVSEAPATDWSYTRRWNGSAMEWSSAPYFEGPVAVGSSVPDTLGGTAMRVEGGLFATTDAGGLPLSGQTWLPFVVQNAGYTAAAFSGDGGVDVTLGDLSNLYRGGISYLGPNNAQNPHQIKIYSQADLNFAAPAEITWGVNNQTPIMFLDTSATRLGIGTTSPEEVLHIAGNDPSIRLQNLGVRQWEMRVVGQDYQIYSQSSDAARIVINNSGNVGMGTDAPTQRLHIKASAPIIRIEPTGASGYIDAHSSTVTQLIIRVGSGPSPTARFYRASNGDTRFSVGNINPSHKIHAYGNKSNPNSVLGDDPEIGVIIQNANGSTLENRADLIFKNLGNLLCGISGVYERYSASGNGSALGFWTTELNTGLTVTEKMRLTHDGRLGIGTLTPQYQVEITGDCNLVGGQFRINGVPIGGGSTESYWEASGNNIYNANTGNVGINETTPAYPLEVGGDINIINGVLRYNGVPIDTGGGGGGFWTDNGTDIYNTNTGDVGIGDSTPSYKLDVNGTIRATSDVIAYSDLRLKTNLEPIQDAIEKVQSLTGYTFEKEGVEGRMAGVIAQQIQDVLPEAVSEDDEGMLSVSSGQVQALLVQAIKDLSIEVDYLRGKLDAASD